MNLTQAREFLLAVGSKASSVSPDGWVRASCPLAPWFHDSGKDSNPSFGLRVVPNGESYFNCWACKSGDLLMLVQLLKSGGAGLPRYDLAKAVQLIADEEEGSTISLKIDEFAEFAKPNDDPDMDIAFSEEWLMSFKVAWKVPLALEYLAGRGVSKELAIELDLRFDTSKKRVCFPIRNFKGVLVGLRGRTIDAQEGLPPYHDYGGEQTQRNRMPWYGENLIDFDKPVVMPESVFDYASVFRVYRNVLAPMTVGMGEQKLKRVQEALEIVTLFDNGKGGDKARLLVDKYLPGSVRVHRLPPPNRKDAGEMSVDEVRECLHGLVEFDDLLA